MRTRLVAVVGSGRPLGVEDTKLAERLGGEIVRAGFGIVCGGRGGIMEAVCRGASRARGTARHPPLVGILPGYDASEGNDYLDIVLPSGLGHARNALVAAAGDALVCLGGDTGALSEVALARKVGRPVLAFKESGGTATLVERALEAVIGVSTVEEAMKHLNELLSA